jgi:hypothetical protein
MLGAGMMATITGIAAVIPLTHGERGGQGGSAKVLTLRNIFFWRAPLTGIEPKISKKARLNI